MSIANTTILLKKSTQSGVVPTSLRDGELAINSSDGKLFYSTPTGSISFFKNSQSFSTVNVAGTLILADSPSDILSFSAAGGLYVWGNTITKSMDIGLGPYAIDIANNTNSVDAYTGALIVSGGVGVGGNLNISGQTSGIYYTGPGNVDFIVANTINGLAVTNYISNTGAHLSFGFHNGDQAVKVTDQFMSLYTTGYRNKLITGVGLDFSITRSNQQDALHISDSSGTVTVNNTTDSTSTLTGSLLVKGGLGVSSNIYSSKVYTDGIFYSSNGNPIFVLNDTLTSTSTSQSATSNSVNAVYQYSQSTLQYTNSVSANTVYLKGGLDSANSNISYLFGVSNTQNSNIIELSNYIQSVYNSANSIGIYNQGINDTQNTEIVSVLNITQDAYNVANNAIKSSGLQPNIILFANNTGYAANDVSNLAFFSSNNTLVVSNIVVPSIYTTTSGVVFPDGTTQSTSATTIVQPAFNKANSSVQTGFTTINANSVSVLSTSNADTLTIIAGNNISISACTTSKSITIDSTASGGGSGTTLDQFARDTANSKVYNYRQNTAPATANNSGDFWTNTDTGVVYENFGNTSNPIWAEFGPTGITNNTAPGIIAATQADISGQLSVTYTPPTTTGSAIQIAAANTRGGTGYADVLQFTNTSGGATNPNKTIRVNITGGIEVIDSNYGNNIFTITDGGNVSSKGTITPGTYAAGQVIKDTMLSNSEVTVVSTTIAPSGTNTNFITYNYTPVSASSYLVVHFHLSRYEPQGTTDDSWFSILSVDGTEISYGWQMVNDNGTGTSGRSGVLFPLMGRYTNSSTSTKQIQVAARRDAADDSIIITNSSTAIWLRITEIAR